MSFKIETSENAAYFKVNGLEHQKAQYVIKYDSVELGEQGRNFSLCSASDGSALFSSRGYGEILDASDNPITSWGELLRLLSSVGALASNDVKVQDQASPPFDFFFTQIKGAPTTVAVEVVFDEYEVTVTDASNCDIGDYFGMFNADDPNDNRYSFATVLDKVGNVLTLDAPNDFAFQVGDTAACFRRNMNIDGSAASETFRIQVGPNATQSIDITRLMVSMLTAGAVSLSKFGDLDSLVRGLVLRQVNGYVRNIWNVKNNGEIANLCFDYDPQTADNPAQGQNGAKFRYTFAGQDKHGVVIRLHPGDSLELIIQDDLEDLQQFRVIAEGHLVEL